MRDGSQAPRPWIGASGAARVQSACGRISVPCFSRAGAWATAAAPPVGDRPASYQKASSCWGDGEVSRVDVLVTWSRHGVLTCKRARDARSSNSMSRCPSSVCTFTCLISSSMAHTVS